MQPQLRWQITCLLCNTEQGQVIEGGNLTAALAPHMVQEHGMSEADIDQLSYFGSNPDTRALGMNYEFYQEGMDEPVASATFIKE